MKCSVIVLDEYSFREKYQPASEGTIDAGKPNYNEN